MPMHRYRHRGARRPAYSAPLSEQNHRSPFSERLLKVMVARVGSCLRDHRQQGIVTSERGPGPFVLWPIAR